MRHAAGKPSERWPNRDCCAVIRGWHPARRADDAARNGRVDEAMAQSGGKSGHSGGGSGERATKRSAGVVSDEEFARRLLIEHFTKEGMSGFLCTINTNEPPDLIVTWNDGGEWGVEVTRTYQQVPSGDTASTSSSADLTEPLFRFGQQLGEATKDIRKRDYFLSLGPDPADSIEGRPTDFGRSWKRKSEQAIRLHIEEDKTDILRLPGVWLKPGGLGNGWRVAASAGVAEMSSATFSILERALAEKVKALPRWNGNLAKRWLLLLNSYPLVNDVEEVREALGQLFRSNPSLCGFDGVFWSGCSNRALVPIQRP